MKAQELRIGNLVNYDGSLIKVNVLLISDNMDKYKGLPLTEEWLIKFGFHSDDGEWFQLYYVDAKRYLLKGLKQDHIEMCLDLTTTAQAPCKYVHQLQNLYYCLTGKEIAQ